MAALEVTGAPYEPVLVDLASDRAELRAANPMGKVPALQTDDMVITDTVAIMYWLARRYPESGLIPADEDITATVLSRLAWFGNVPHIVRRRYVRPMFFAADEAAQASIRQMAEGEYRAALKLIDSWVGEDDVPLAPKLYALLFYHWATMDAVDLGGLSDYQRVVDSMLEMPGPRRALAAHDSPLL